MASVIEKYLSTHSAGQATDALIQNRTLACGSPATQITAPVTSACWGIASPRRAAGSFNIRGSVDGTARLTLCRLPGDFVRQTPGERRD